MAMSDKDKNAFLGQLREIYNRKRDSQPGFMIYREECEGILWIPDANAGAIIKAVCQYFYDGDVSMLYKLSDRELGAAKRLIEKMIEGFYAYEKKCATKRANANARWKKEKAQTPEQSDTVANEYDLSDVELPY